MRADEKQDFARLLTDALAFYRQDMSAFTLAVWWQACSRYSLEQVQKALTAHAIDADKGRFAPRPADIVRQLEGTRTDRSLLAWGKVLDAMGSVGAYRDVVFDDAAIHAVVEDLGGWVKLCRTPTAELGLLQHRFCETHRAYTARGQFDYPRALMGDRSPDEVYARHGLPVPRPVVVGDTAAARLVWKGGGHRCTKALAVLVLEGVQEAARQAHERQRMVA